MEEIEEVAEILNPWWKTKSVNKELAKPYKREIFKKIFELEKYKQIVLLSGLRRVGKTTMLYQLIEGILLKYDSKKVFYFNFDKKIEDFIKVLDSYSNLTKINWKEEKIFVFLDEVTKLEDWADKIKLIYDAYPNIKIFISSSSSLKLEESAVKSLGGRYFLINVKPLSFKEFLEIKDKKEYVSNIRLYEKEIKKELEEYLFKSFPEIINFSDKLLVKDYLRTTLIDKIIKSDLEDKFKNLNKDLLFELIKIFFNEPGIYLDYDNLSKSLRISKKTLFKHIFYLEFSYLLRRVKNFRPGYLTSSKKMQRAYANWWVFDYCYGDNFDKIIENVVISSSDALDYWRDKDKEIDVILKEDKKIIPIEVKNKEKWDKGDLKNLIYFMNKYNINEGFLIYMGKEDCFNFDRRHINIVPLWKWLLQKSK